MVFKVIPFPLIYLNYSIDLLQILSSSAKKRSLPLNLPLALVIQILLLNFGIFFRLLQSILLHMIFSRDFLKKNNAYHLVEDVQGNKAEEYDDLPVPSISKLDETVEAVSLICRAYLFR